MLDVRMDTAVAHQSEKVKLPLPTAFHCFEQQRLTEEFAAGNHLIHAGDVHVNDTACAHVHMAHFAVAHLSLGQADEGARGVNERVREVLQQTVIVGLARQGDGVAFRFGAESPAVENGEYDWLGSFCHGRSGYHALARGKCGLNHTFCTLEVPR